MTTVVLLPGFGGRADQPILTKLEQRLEGVTCTRLAPPRLKLTPDLEAWVDWLEGAVPPGKLALVGRSFGGRLAVRLAARRRLVKVALLGCPVRPPKRPRPLDEAALAAMKVPTLIVQGDADALGPLAVLRPIVERNPLLELEVIAGATHAFGRHERRALDRCAEWLSLA